MDRYDDPGLRDLDDDVVEMIAEICPDLSPSEQKRICRKTRKKLKQDKFRPGDQVSGTVSLHRRGWYIGGTAAAALLIVAAVPALFNAIKNVPDRQPDISEPPQIIEAPQNEQPTEAASETEHPTDPEKENTQSKKTTAVKSTSKETDKKSPETKTEPVTEKYPSPEEAVVTAPAVLSTRPASSRTSPKTTAKGTAAVTVPATGVTAAGTTFTEPQRTSRTTKTSPTTAAQTFTRTQTVSQTQTVPKTTTVTTTEGGSFSPGFKPSDTTISDEEKERIRSLIEENERHTGMTYVKKRMIIDDKLDPNGRPLTESSLRDVIDMNGVRDFRLDTGFEERIIKSLNDFFGAPDVIYDGGVTSYEYWIGEYALDDFQPQKAFYLSPDTPGLWLVDMETGEGENMEPKVTLSQIERYERANNCTYLRKRKVLAGELPEKTGAVSLDDEIAMITAQLDENKTIDEAFARRVIAAEDERTGCADVVRTVVKDGREITQYEYWLSYHDELNYYNSPWRTVIDLETGYIAVYNTFDGEPYYQCIIHNA